MNYFFKVPILLFFLLGPPLLARGQDSTTKENHHINELDSLFDTHYQQANDLRKARKHEEALTELQKAENIAMGYDVPQLLAKAAFLRGRVFIQMGKYQETLPIFDKLLQYPEDVFPTIQRGRALSEQATAYQNLGEYSKAVNSHLEALKIFEKDNYSKGKFRSLYELGRTYFQKEEYQKALDYFEQTLALVEQDASGTSSDSIRLFHCFSAIGSAHEKLQDLEQSLYYTQRSHQLAKELKDKRFLASAKQNLGTNYTELKQFESAENHLLESLALFEAAGDKWGMTGTFLYLGKLYTKWDKPTEALPYLEDGLELASQIESKDQIMEFFLALADTHRAQGNHEASDKYLRSYIGIRESVINEAAILDIKEAQWDYTLFKKQSQIELLEKEKQVSRLRSMVFAILLLISLAGLMLFFRWNRKQRETNAILTEKKLKIETANRELKQVNEELRQFTSVVSHDLREPLRTISNFSTLLERHYGSQLDEGGKAYIQFVRSAAGRMHKLLEDLLAYSRIDRKKIPDEWVPVSDTISSALANLQGRIGETGASIQVNYTDMPTVRGSSSHLIQLFQNLIGNGIKFQTNSNPVIQIDCQFNGKYYIFSVQDNGIGIPEEKKETIFEMFSRLHGQEAFEGTGIGLPTCKKIVEKHGGSIWVESELGQGSTFYFTIPKKNARIANLDREKNKELQPIG